MGCFHLALLALQVMAVVGTNDFGFASDGIMYSGIEGTTVMLRIEVLENTNIMSLVSDPTVQISIKESESCCCLCSYMRDS